MAPDHPGYDPELDGPGFEPSHRAEGGEQDGAGLQGLSSKDDDLDREQRGDPTPPARGLAPRTRGWVRARRRALVHVWRGSLQFRVVSTTLLMGFVVVLLLGSYLFQSISDGLESDRISTARQQAAALTNEAQRAFDTTDRTNSEAELTLFTTDILKRLAEPGADQSRFVILVRGSGTNRPFVVPTLISGQLGTPSIPADLRAAVAANPGTQQIQLIGVSVREGQARVAAVVVGSQVVLPLAGPYELYVVFPMEREQTTLELISRTFFLGGLVLVLLVGAIAWFVTRLVVTPVRRAANVAERLASGRLNERMRAKGEDDLALLGKTFNDMADSLQTQIRQLEGLSRLQQRFVSDVSHELRTPLTTIRMAADVLHDSRVEFGPTTARSSELLHNELERFEELLGDLLEISRFDAGAAALEANTTDLRATLTRAVASAEMLAQARGSRVTVHQPKTPVLVEMDARRVERVLRNLLVNAIEHGEGRPVEVWLDSNETAAAIAVRDLGVGLRPGESGLVFNRFWRADPARARTTGGTGLGLAISLEDARLHNGWLQAWGEPGEGSCFRLTLPLRQDATIEQSPLPLRPFDDDDGGPTEAQARDMSLDAAQGRGATPTVTAPEAKSPAGGSNTPVRSPARTTKGGS